MPTESQQIARINAQLGAAVVEGVVAGIAAATCSLTTLSTDERAIPDSRLRAGPNVRRSRGAVAQSKTAAGGEQGEDPTPSLRLKAGAQAARKSALRC